MAKPTLTCTTPHGVFTRKTARSYKFCALHAYKDRRPLQDVGFRGTVLTIRAFWSTSREGALKLANEYPYEPPKRTPAMEVLGVWPVDAVAS